MKFLSIREFRSSTGQLKEMLSDGGKIVLTSNGKPAALMIEADEEDFEDVLDDIRAAQSKRAIRNMRARAAVSGLDGMSLDDINAEISASRRERTP